MRSVAIGFASGLGNCVMMLPAVKAIKSMDCRVTLYVQTDFPTIELWRRCVYADEVLEASANLNGHKAVCGNWRPTAWALNKNILQCRLPQIHASEWRSNLKVAETLGWRGGEPDVSDWCRDLDRLKKWDVGIIPGCKGGIWLRKRYPGMPDVARQFLAVGRSVGVFGQEQDGIGDIPGEHVKTDLMHLPDALTGCRVIVGTESGVTHLASSLGIPTVMIYTGTSERKSDPVCKPNRKVVLPLPCHPCVSTPHWQNCRDWRCRQIPVETVMNAANDLLEAK